MPNGLLASVDAIRNRVVSIEALDTTFKLQSPSVEKHIRLRKAQKQIETQAKEEKQEESWLSFMIGVAKLQACLVEDIDFNRLSLTILSMREHSAELIATAASMYTISFLENKEQLRKEFKERSLDEVMEEEIKVPFLLRENLE